MHAPREREKEKERPVVQRHRRRQKEKRERKVGDGKEIRAGDESRGGREGEERRRSKEQEQDARINWEINVYGSFFLAPSSTSSLFRHPPSVAARERERERGKGGSSMRSQARASSCQHIHSVINGRGIAFQQSALDVRREKERKEGGGGVVSTRESERKNHENWIHYWMAV